ncbi:hypothetical protein [Mitsuaria sp. GD03876]|uniref:hypothetical protein n=1 Tax=Mitsuaria sp. GD03876 TaxID=2975399 RepID=UPI00244D73AC|nr:hypothetical protein [Mitsuaria sp. GD03876]MDH0867296.1 hypothetical protein [Mitsuaria sp. GD03876]
MPKFRITGHPAGAPADVDASDDDDTRPLCPSGRHRPVEERPAADRTFAPAHEQALRALRNAVRPSGDRRGQVAPAGPLPAALAANGAVSLVLPAVLAHFGDLLDIRHDDVRGLAGLDLGRCSREVAAEFVRLLAAMVDDEELPPVATLLALGTPGPDGRPPFLLRLADEAVHDRAVAAPMCDLLLALGRRTHEREVPRALLAMDSRAGARTGDALPQGMPAKYTDFIGRLIGDGLGEWRNEGAVHAIGRLGQAGLLPGKEEVVDRHSGSRWRKQQAFVQICDDLRQRRAWRDDEHLPATAAATRDRLASLLDELSERRALAAHQRDAGDGDRAARDCVDETLARQWPLLRNRLEHALYTHVMLPQAFPSSATIEPPSERVAHGMRGQMRMPKAPPPRVTRQVLAEVLRELGHDPARDRGANQRVRLDPGPCLQDVVRRRVEAALDPAPLLEALFPDKDKDKEEAPVLRHATGAVSRSPGRVRPDASFFE